MKQKRNKAILAVILAILLCFTYVPTSVKEVHAANNYNASAALAYASAHWNDGVGLCAEFVSRCAQAGGLNIGTYGYTIDCFEAIESATGVQRQDLALDSYGHATKALNGNKLAAGDIVIQWCYTDGLRPHIAICCGFDSSGRALYYAHNNAMNAGLWPLNSHPDHPGHSLGAKVLHISGGGDSTPPTVQDFHVGEIQQSNGVGFTVMAKVTDTSGIKSVRYAVWTVKNDQDDIKWYDGVCTDNNDYYWARIPFSEHKNEKGIYRVHIYAYDNNNNVTNLGIDFDFDSTGPTYYDFHVGEFREGAFTVLGKVKAVNGVKNVRYAVWTEKNGQDDMKWYNGNPNLPGDNLYWARVDFSNHKGEKGKYIIYMEAYDKADQKVSAQIKYTFPETGPSISNIVVSNVSSNGYTVTCNVSNANKDAGVSRVQFPTWTDKNGQDDIASDWDKNQNVKGTIKDGVATFVVKASDHNYESGIYHTHIYAYDVFGNATSVRVPDVNVHNHSTVLIKGKAATCTETGLTDGKKCTICNEIIVKQQVIPAKGHTVVIDKGIPATKTSIGLTEGSHCSVCNAVLKRQQVIPALGGKDDPNPTNPTNPTTEQPATTTPSADNGENKQNTDNGVGTISADGRTLTDTDNVKYYVSGKLKNKDLKKNLKIADKKSGGKYKITKVIKKNGKVVGGNVTYMAPYNKNCTKATAGATVKLGGVNFKITALNANAFKNCKKLATFKAGGNMITIGKNAFSGCSSLKSVTITSTKLKSIGTGAFKGTTAKTKFKVPKSKLTKYTIMILKAGASINSKITK